MPRPHETLPEGPRNPGKRAGSKALEKAGVSCPDLMRLCQKAPETLDEQRTEHNREGPRCSLLQMTSHASDDCTMQCGQTRADS
eukprot:1157853-Pelagomonas_calceolata.AAC.13